MILSNNYLQQLKSSQLMHLAKFVVTENFNHHSKEGLPNNYENDVLSIYKEELNYFENAHFFVAKDEKDNILGSIRALKWDYKNELPIQKIFGINPLLVVGDIQLNNIWHIGRFAIKKGMRDINLFKQLMVCAIAPICLQEGNIAFAECDSKLLRVLSLLGIQSNVIGESIQYLGSETIPISMTYSGLINFYKENKSLVSEEILIQSIQKLGLPKSVVSHNQIDNYSLV